MRRRAAAELVFRREDAEEKWRVFRCQEEHEVSVWSQQNKLEAKGSKCQDLKEPQSAFIETRYFLIGRSLDGGQDEQGTGDGGGPSIR